MEEIRIQKIDGQEFVSLKDYQKLKEERDNRKDEYKKAIDRENERVYNCQQYYSETMEERRKNKELKEENEKLKFDIEAWKKLKAIWEEENKELKEEFKQYKEHYNTEKDKQQIFLMTGKRY